MGDARQANATSPTTRIICLTGKMAAGKNHIASLMAGGDFPRALSDAICARGAGIAAIDLDETAHEAVALCAPQILAAFSDEAARRGVTLTREDGSLDRRALGKIVFSDKNLLARQESIVHPKITAMVSDFISENTGKTIVLNATVLYKTPELLSRCGAIIFVRSCLIKRLLRARRRDKLPLRQILARLRNQRRLLAEYRKFARARGIPLLIVRN